MARCHDATRLWPGAYLLFFTLLFAGHSAHAQPPAATGLPDGWVVLTVDEYRALRQRALPGQPVTPTPPASTPAPAAVLTRIDYDLRVASPGAGNPATVSGRATLTIDVLRDGWTAVAIPDGLMVRDARVDGRPASVVRDKNTQILLSRVGRTTVTLDVAMPLVTTAGSESVTVPPSPASITRVSLAVPRNQVTLTSSERYIAEQTTAGDESRWITYARPQQPLVLSWKRAVEERRIEQPLRIRARVWQLVGLGEDLSLLTANVWLDVQQGQARDLLIALPAGVTINAVDGPHVSDWDVKGSELRVRFMEPVTGESPLRLTGDLRAPREGVVTIPVLRVPDAERESGGIAVDVVGSGELNGQQARGMDAADTSELTEIVAGRESPSMSAFRFRPLSGSDPRALTVNVVRYTPQAVLIANVEEARYRALMTEDGRVLVEARYAVRNNQRSFLKVTLPDGATLWSAEVRGRPIRPGVASPDGGGAGEPSVLLPLEKGRAGEDAPTFAVALFYVQRAPEWARLGSGSLPLPALDLPVSRTGVELDYSPRYKVDVEPGTFRIAANVGPQSEALRFAPPRVDLNYPAVPPPPAPPAAVVERRSLDQNENAGLRVLVDRFKNEAGGRTSTGTLPVAVAFPSFGSSVFLASELTAELQAPVITFTFKRIRE